MTSARQFMESFSSCGRATAAIDAAKEPARVFVDLAGRGHKWSRDQAGGFIAAVFKSGVPVEITALTYSQASWTEEGWSK